MRKRLQLKVENEDCGKTVGDLLISGFALSKRAITILKRYEQGILLNGEPVTVRRFVHCGDILDILILPDDEYAQLIPTEMPLDILYEDDDILVVNKPSNLAVHPSIAHPFNTLGNGVVYYLQHQGEEQRYRPLTRLDKDTSGIVLIAKSAYVQSHIYPHHLQKYYIALVEGDLQGNGVIEAAIAKMPGEQMKRHVDPNGKYARTEYTVLSKEENYSKVLITLTTGRTHQIRVHFSHIGHPLLGDSLYGGDCSVWKRQALHSYQLNMVHPMYDKTMIFEAPLPKDWREFQLRS